MPLHDRASTDVLFLMQSAALSFPSAPFEQIHLLCGINNKNKTE